MTYSFSLFRGGVEKQNTKATKPLASSQEGFYVYYYRRMNQKHTRVFVTLQMMEVMQ